MEQSPSPEDLPRLSRRGLIRGAAGAAVVAGATATAAGPAAASTGQSGNGDSTRSGPADTAYYNGHILTLDRKNTVADWVTVRDGKIDAVGRGSSVPSAVRRVNLGGATMIPGLIDSHVHFIRDGINPGHEVRIIETATSIAELITQIRQRARTVPAGEFITCIGGWNRNGFAEKRLPTPAELDQAAPRNPVYLSELGGAGVTNTLGAAFFTAHGVAVDATGVVASTSAAMAALVAVQTDADRLRGTREAIAFASSLGLTMIHDMGGLIGLDSYQYSLELWRQRTLDLRIRFYHYSGNDTGISLMETRIDNNLNRLGDDYYRPIGVGERVNTVTTNPLFVDACTYVAQKGWTITQHSLTPAEVAFHISAYQQAASVAAIDKLRWSLAHVNPITDAQIALVKQLGIALNIQGYAYVTTATSPPMAGPPFRKLVDAGIPLGGGSDATNVTALNPWLMMSYMTTGKNNAGIQTNDPTQSISRLEALRLYTSGSAYLTFDEDKLGSIEPGKLADLAVLSDNPLTASEKAFHRIEANLTVVGGRVVQKSGRFASV